MRARLSPAAIAFGCAKGYVLRKKWVEALEELAAFEVIEGFTSESFEMTTETLQALGAWDALVRYCRRVLVARRWKHESGWRYLIRANRFLKNWDEVRYVVDQALQRFPVSRNILLESALTECAAGNFEKVSALLMRALQADVMLSYEMKDNPELQDYWLWLGDLEPDDSESG